MTEATTPRRGRGPGRHAARLVGGTMAAVLGLGSMIVFSLATVTAATAESGTGWLRLAHFSPNTPPVDVYLYSFHNPTAKIVLHHVAYGTASPYELVPVGAYTVAMRAAGASASSAPVLSATVRVAPRHAYTVAGLGPAKGLRLKVLNDRLRTPRGKALVRIIQASLKQHVVRFTAGPQLLAANLAFGDVTPYQAVGAGTWHVRAAGATERTASAIALPAGSIHTIVLLDDPHSLKLDDLVDAAGSGLVPAGAPGTGFGGTAPRPGPSPAPWLIMAGAGALAALGGGYRVLRPRGAHTRHPGHTRAA
jgi:hypothetical protein